MRYDTKKQLADRELTIYFEREPDNLSIPADAEEVVRLAIDITLQSENFFEDVEVSVTFCDGPHIRALNATYRNKDAETDVLSFPLFDEDEADPIFGETVPLGDIVLNLDRAAQQGAELGHSAMREAAFLTVHSTLHLLGYDHERSPEDEEEMCRRQREIIALVEKTFIETKGKSL